MVRSAEHGSISWLDSYQILFLLWEHEGQCSLLLWPAGWITIQLLRQWDIHGGDWNFNFILATGKLNYVQTGNQ